MIKRNNDLIYGNEDLEFLYKHERFPAFMGCVKSSIENDILFICYKFLLIRPHTFYIFLPLVVGAW